MAIQRLSLHDRHGVLQAYIYIYIYMHLAGLSIGIYIVIIPASKSDRSSPDKVALNLIALEVR